MRLNITINDLVTFTMPLNYLNSPPSVMEGYLEWNSVNKEVEICLVCKFEFGKHTCGNKIYDVMY